MLLCHILHGLSSIRIPSGPSQAQPIHKQLAKARVIVAIFEIILCSSLPTQLCSANCSPPLGTDPTTANGALSLPFGSRCR